MSMQESKILKVACRSILLSMKIVTKSLYCERINYYLFILCYYSNTLQVELHVDIRVRILQIHLHMRYVIGGNWGENIAELWLYGKLWWNMYIILHMMVRLSAQQKVLNLQRKTEYVVIDSVVGAPKGIRRARHNWGYSKYND